MKLPRRLFLQMAAGAGALPVISRIAGAQSYPTRPITMIVPFPAGGPTDAVGRTFADRMRSSLGQAIIIENAAGANGGIGSGRVARAAPDGYTLLLGNWNTHVSNGAFYKLSYDVVKDFVPLSFLVSFPVIIAANKAVPAKDLKELVAWLKAKPGGGSQGSAGIGSGGHVTGIHFQDLTGVRFQHVPYRGSAPAMQDLMAGHVDMMIDAPVIVLPQVRAGTIKAYAVTAKSRLSSAPDIPTVDEAGLPGLYFLNWFALWAPKGTPAIVIAKVNAAVADTLADPAVRQRLVDMGFEIPSPEQQTPEALGALQKDEIEKWWPIIKAADIKQE